MEGMNESPSIELLAFFVKKKKSSENNGPSV
jgi:hypothetical protein